jgi:serine/threonine-protein kinase
MTAKPPEEPDWERVEELFHAASALPEAEWGAFLDRECGEDGALQREVASLLGWSEQSADFTRLAIEPHHRVASALITRSPGDTLGPYRILREVGEGGMSRVYLAERADEQYRMQVAVKVIRPGLDTPALLDRLRQERQILANLNHPYIAHLLDGGTTEDGTPFVVMEYVEGVTIDRFCEEGGLSLEGRLELFLKVCNAVQYAHRNLIIHRDLKPNNLLVTADGTPKLLDFGIAKVLNPESFPQDVSETQAGLWLLTPQYASPEQIRGEELTTGSDIYSLGVLLYRLLAGAPPYRLEGKSPGAVERTVCEEPVPAPSELAPEGARNLLRGDLDSIILHALEKDPEARYASVERLADDLERYRVGLPVSVRGSTFGYRARRFLRRHRTAFLTATAVLLLLITVVGFYTYQLKRERDQARRLANEMSHFTVFVNDVIKQSNPSETQAQEVTVREAVERMAEKVEQLEEEPALQAALRFQVGGLYSSLYQFDKAEVQLRESLRIRRQLYPGPNLEVAESANDLGKALYFQGDVEEAEALVTEAWQLRRRLLGPDAEETVESQNNLAAVLEALGEYERAEPIFWAVLERRRSLSKGKPSVEVAETLNNLAAVHWSLQELEEAETLYRQALEIKEKLYKPPHGDIATAMNNLAALLSDRQDHQTARDLFAEALAMNRTLFGDIHPYVSRGLHRLAGEERALGNLASAEVHFREALQLHRQIAPEDPRIGRWLVDLGGLLVEDRRCAAAEALLREAASQEAPGAADLLARCGLTTSRS